MKHVFEAESFLRSCIV